MGYGYWTRERFASYSAARGRGMNPDGSLDSSLTAQQLFGQRGLHPALNPFQVTRECCDTQAHPETVPVMLALDVTGSMGKASAEVARKMNTVMTDLYGQVKDVEFLVMGIGDLSYDRAPIQISQFESDIRIAEQLDQIWLEHGGGGNDFESYSAAWYMGLRHTRLDCWKRGKRGLIITMGDEPMNPYLPREPLSAATGDSLQADVETGELARETLTRYDLYHIHVLHSPANPYRERAAQTFQSVLPQGHFSAVGVDAIAGELVRIVKKHAY